MIISTLNLLPSSLGDTCSYSKSQFLGFPHWYQYLQGIYVPSGTVTTGNAVGQLVCNPQFTGLNDTWLVVAAIIEILLRIASIAAVGYIIYGGIRYTISQGEPDATAKARGTLINALVGLLLAISAAAIVQFIAGRFQNA